MWAALTLPILLCAIIFSMIVLQLSIDILRNVYSAFPEEPTGRYTVFSGIAGTIVALISVLVALGTYWFTVRANRRAQRKQHTISVLLDTRLSDRFHTLNVQRRYSFPEYEDITFTAWNSARNATYQGNSEKGKQAAADRVASAHAVTSLLNYYEFLAVGIQQGDLDEDLLYKTIRGIMCNLVDDCRLLIAHMRGKNKATYENLLPLYEKWRRKNSIDINGKPNERPIPRS